MGYKREAFAIVRAQYEKKRLYAEHMSDEKKKDIYTKLPEIQEIDLKMAQTAIRLIRLVLAKENNIENSLNDLKNENLSLQAQRAKLLSDNGYTEDYTEPHYECNDCSDTGYIGIDMCPCMKKALARETVKLSGLGRLIEQQTFDKFSIEYYSQDASSYENMKNIYDFCRNYAEGFDCTSNSLIFIGATGLGKTHLSTAIAARVIERGFDVKYVTALNLISDFEYERFMRKKDDDTPNRTDDYFDCDMLIIDDLGTEISNQFSISSLYNLINTRTNGGKPIIINTNLTQKELRDRYQDRITSRLFGELLPMVFSGRDVRMKKIL